jgi:hypothetical protein
MGVLKGAQPEISKMFPIRAASAWAGGQVLCEGFLCILPTVLSQPVLPPLVPGLSVYPLPERAPPGLCFLLLHPLLGEGVAQPQPHSLPG